MSFVAGYAGVVCTSSQCTSIQNPEFWCSLDSTCSQPARPKISWWCWTSSVAMGCSLRTTNGWMALKATGAFRSWPPMQIALLTRIGLSVLDLLSFLTALPDFSGKYCCWTYFMMALEASMLIWSCHGWTWLVHCIWTSQIKECMIDATVLTSLGHKENFVNNLSEEEPAAAVVV